VLLIGQGGRIGRVFQIERAVAPIDRDLLIGQELLIDKVLLIGQGGRIGRVFQIERAVAPIDRDLLIGQELLIDKVLLGLESQ
jgi:UDP-3-O-[3-hydroxymyristoyl] glucosamine N-acyltransferase